MTASSGDDDLTYHPPPPPVPHEPEESAEQEPDAATAGIVRRSRALVASVVVGGAVLLAGAIVAIVMLSASLLAAVDKGDAAAPVPVVEAPQPAGGEQSDAQDAPDEVYTPPVRSGAEECGTLCAALEDEVGTQAGDWRLELAWADAVTEIGAQDAASAVFSSPAGSGTFTVLQFADDAEAAEAAVRIQQRIGSPSYETNLFEDGSGMRYDYVGALVSRVLWHPDENSHEHVPGRLYLVEAPTAETPDFSTQPAFLLYLALPI